MIGSRTFHRFNLAMEAFMRAADVSRPYVIPAFRDLATRCGFLDHDGHTVLANTSVLSLVSIVLHANQLAAERAANEGSNIPPRPLLITVGNGESVLIAYSTVNDNMTALHAWRREPGDYWHSKVDVLRNGDPAPEDSVRWQAVLSVPVF